MLRKGWRRITAKLQFEIETNMAIASLLNEPEVAMSLEAILNARMRVLSLSHAVESHRQVQPYLSAYPVQTIFLEPGPAGERTAM